MATTYDKASLVMIPSGYKDDKLYSVKPTDGSGDFTFSRDGSGASPATRVNASGLIEKGRTNEILYSNAFNNAYWNKTAVTISTGQADPNGGNNAFKIVEDTSINFHRINGAYTMVSGNVYATSVTAKAAGRNFLSMSNNVSAGTTMFDLTDGSVHLQESGVVAAKTTDLGGGWYRCEMVAVGDKNGSYNVFLGCDDDGTIGTYLGDGTSGVLIFQSQLEDGLVATDYIKTTTAPVSAGLLGDMPRLDYSGGATCPSLLLEPSRVNIIESSEYLGHSPWVFTRITQSPNDAVSPEGVQNATLIANTTATGAHSAENPLGSYTNASLAVSFYAKKKDNDYLQFGIYNSSTKWAAQKINLATGAILGSGNTGFHDAPSGVNVTPVGNDWYKVEALFTTSLTSASETLYLAPTPTDANPTGNFGLYGGWTGSTSENAYIYGVQVEASASYPTSYIPTYGSASTRGADDCSKTSVASLIGDTEGTIFLEGAYNRAASGNNVFFELINSPNQLVLYMDSTTNELKLYNSENPTNRLTLSSGDNRGVNHKIALAYKDNDFAIYLDGVAQSVTGTNLVPTGMANIYVGQNRTGGEVGQSIYKQILLFKTRLTNAELAALTA